MKLAKYSGEWGHRCIGTLVHMKKERNRIQDNSQESPRPVTASPCAFSVTMLKHKRWHKTRGMQCRLALFVISTSAADQSWGRHSHNLKELTCTWIPEDLFTHHVSTRLRVLLGRTHIGWFILQSKEVADFAFLSNVAYSYSRMRMCLSIARQRPYQCGESVTHNFPKVYVPTCFLLVGSRTQFLPQAIWVLVF